MIPLRFGLWWSGGKLSYLRYLTLKSLRHFHPNEPIELWKGTGCKKDGYKWNIERQDFEIDIDGNDYMNDVSGLNIIIKETDAFNQYPANFQSDFWRWHFLKEGGWYLDMDQIVLKSFDTLPLNNDLICSVYNVQSCGTYAPVGCLGASKDSEIVEWVIKLMPQVYNPNLYNSIGPFLFRDILGLKAWKDKIFNTPSNYFYPIPESFMMPIIIYNNDQYEIPKGSYSLHWFGGLPASQEFNRKYTPEFAKTSNDAISRFLRDKQLI
jgi:hypothetical protein